MPEPRDLDAALSGLISVADQVGKNSASPGAHGSAFDRINAFQIGYEEGPRQCDEFLDNPPEYFGAPFTDIEDLAAGGNLPVEEIIPLVTKGLDEYWATDLTGYKPISAVIPYDVDILSESRLPACGDERPNPELRGHDLLLRGKATSWRGTTPARDRVGELATSPWPHSSRPAGPTPCTNA